VTAPAKSGGRDSVLIAVDVVNSWDPWEGDPERLPDVDIIKRFLVRRGAPAHAERMRNQDLGAFRALRDELRHTFEAPDEEHAVEVLNGVLRTWPATPQLVRAASRWELDYRGAEPIAGLATELALALLGLIESGGWARFGRCAGSPCVCVFVDRSKSRSRRYCSQLCADRVNQAAYRRRARSGI
jgi:predicted RNA-binding Zn ribbon-like protein